MVKIGICKSVEIETDVNVDVDDIACAIYERLTSVTERYLGLSSVAARDARSRELMGFVSSIFTCFKAISDELIEETKSGNREIVARSLREQAERWQTPDQGQPT